MIERVWRTKDQWRWLLSKQHLFHWEGVACHNHHFPPVTFSHWGIPWIYSLCYTCLKFYVPWEESICRAIILGMLLFHSVLTQLLPQYGRTPGNIFKILPGINTEVYYSEKSRSPAADISSAGQSYFWKTLHRTRTSHISFEDDYCIFTIVLIRMRFSYLSLKENNIRFPFFILAKFT